MSTVKRIIHGLEQDGLILYLEAEQNRRSRRYAIDLHELWHRLVDQEHEKGRQYKNVRFGDTLSVINQFILDGSYRTPQGGHGEPSRGSMVNPDPLVEPSLDPSVVGSNFEEFEAFPSGSPAAAAADRAVPGQKEQPPIPPLSERVPPLTPVVEVGMGGGLAWDWSKNGDWVLYHKLEAEAHAKGRAFKCKGYETFEQMSSFRGVAGRRGDQWTDEAVSMALRGGRSKRGDVIGYVASRDTGQIADAKHQPKVIPFDLNRPDDRALLSAVTKIAVGRGIIPPDGWDTVEQRDKYRSVTGGMNGELERCMQRGAEGGVNNLSRMVQWVAGYAEKQVNGYKGNNAGTVGCGQPVKKGHIERQMKLVSGPAMPEPMWREFPVWVEDDEGGNNDSNTETTGQR